MSTLNLFTFEGDYAPDQDPKFKGCICFQDEHHKDCPAIKTGKCHFQSLYGRDTVFQSLYGTDTLKTLEKEIGLNANNHFEGHNLSADLKSLGSGNTQYIDRYDANLLETFVNPQQHTPYIIDITAPEVTSLCPITKQPDFATFVIQYSPDKLCVESKSLKLYLFSFRQEGIFHEAMTNKVAEDLFKILSPHWLQVQGQFTPRGGIKFWPTVRLEKESK